MNTKNQNKMAKWLSFSVLAVAAGFSFNVQAADYPAPGDVTNGAKVWSANCGRCHNIRGPKELKDDQWITTMFHMRIRGGLTGQDTRDVISFMQASNSKTPASLRKSVSVKSVSSSTATPGLTGKDTYNKTCIACHGADGKGALPGTPDFTDPKGRLSKTDEQLLHSLRNGLQSPGATMAMPAKGGNMDLTDGDLKNVLQYLRDTFGP